MANADVFLPIALGIAGFAVAMAALFLVVKGAIVSALAEDRRRQTTQG